MVSVSSATTQSLSFSNSHCPLGRGDVGGGNERRQEAGVNNPELWGKLETPTCRIQSVIPKESHFLCIHLVLPNLTEPCFMVAVITSTCQCIQACLSVNAIATIWYEYCIGSLYMSYYNSSQNLVNKIVTNIPHKKMTHQHVSSSAPMN